MKRILFVAVMVLFVSGFSCGTSGKKSDETIVVVTTDFGDIKIKLYDDTPKHKNNFVKLVNEGFYDGVLFHRVIDNFMIQAGDPNSKTATATDMLGDGGPGYTVPAEITPEHFHKKGAVAAARLSGPRNPEKNSSGSQFYIVEGETYRPGELDTLEMRVKKQRKDLMMRENLEAKTKQFAQFKEANDRESFNLLLAEIKEKVDSIYDAQPKFALSDEQRQVYTAVGGYPSLDGEYTVFGEVVEGMDVVEKIAAMKTNQINRPLEDVRIKIEMEK